MESYSPTLHPIHQSPFQRPKTPPIGKGEGGEGLKHVSSCIMKAKAINTSRKMGKLSLIFSPIRQGVFKNRQDQFP